jgi:hypothetical protein
LFGAKITGGGSGGTVAIRGASDAAGHVEQIAATYAEGRGLAPYLFTGPVPVRRNLVSYAWIRTDTNQERRAFVFSLQAAPATLDLTAASI